MGLAQLIFCLAAFSCVSGDTRLYFEPLSSTNVRNEQAKAPKLSFASYYNDHMVLQQAPKKSIVWGYADTTDTSQTVYAVLSSNDGSHKSTYETNLKPGEDGRSIWSVQLSSRPAGGPYALNISIQSSQIVLNDILFGDVWLCSGQSNMVFIVSHLTKDMIAHEYNISKNYPDIRLFLVNIKGSTVPLTDLASVALHWSKPSPATLSGFSAVCWLYGRHLQETFNYPIGLITSAVGGTPDEAWSSPDALHRCGINRTVEYEKIPKLPFMSWEQYKAYLDIPTANSVLWNAMIHPFLNLTIYGTIWYQGESDYRRKNYNCTFPAMIADWRSKFHTGTKGETDQEFPFGFVQLGPNVGPAPGKTTTGYPSIRWQQTANHGYVPNDKMPNTFMAAALDLADFAGPYGGVHYRDKETVGARLALSGLTQAYQIPTKNKGPLPTKLSSGSGNMTITYDSGKTPIYVRSTWGFELCCTSKSESECNFDIYGPPWFDAELISHDVKSVTFSTKNCTSPMKALRYLWRASPCDYKMCAIYSVDNELPAPPVYIRKTQLKLDVDGSYIIKW